MQPYELSLTEAAGAIGDGSLSPVELTDSVLARLADTEPLVSAYAAVTADRAREEAAAAEREIAAGRRRGPLHGIPMALKDLIDTAGVETAAGSAVRAGRVPDRDATVAALLKQAGAVLVGKAHTHEFAYGLTTPQTRNPRALDRVPGGSSGGSAAAVAAGSATFALGTDTGGSIRVPAALTGTVGLKPTYGLVSGEGVAALSWSLDHVGPITRTVRDAALVLAAIADRGTAGRAPEDGPEHRRRDGDLRGLRVGVPADYYFDRVDPEVAAAVRAALDRMAGLGARLVDVEIPLHRYVQAVHWGLMVPEATAYHATHLGGAPELYGDDVRVLLEAGALLPAVDHVRAQRARTLLRREWGQLLGRVDLIAAPTVPATAALTGQQAFTWPDGSAESVADAYVRLSAPANVTGLPALSLPVGADRDGLPIGMQLIGRPYGEAALLAAGDAYEQAVGPAPLAEVRQPAPPAGDRRPALVADPS
ncbi:Asp-tRNA(Asn)/Glu-tRNA(Gln) amidotransferase GatCAB subunit A [Streptomyces sp. Ru73]|uniref:amidase n=1 Tax=Streptomyces sp. Ru73 TaxID=2080748 RepID=UPI000CDDC0A4|nr:amidase [Streptomyces sp. Ru73]POX37456.1 Asp-tRNA(Asn)/Glu-tRNA(Gln) amidotransferase GatCAB subunit A [Streptomyces sp. Ru73]